MNISLGMTIRTGPWGGGNQFGRTLVEYLERQGARVSFDLCQPDLDIILLIDPRPTSQTATYSDIQIREYLTHVNPSAIVIHRVNECDERKGTTGVNDTLMAANRIADHTVFVSTWLSELFAPRMAGRPSSVILSGADHSVFHANGDESWDHSGPLRLVTHHWGGSWLKGFDIYQKLDEMIGSPEYNSRFAFTYIGNVPEGFEFKHARYLPPMHGEVLAAELRSHHVYLTASRNEPSGMHHIEGASCGLPLLYIDSGALPEYCQGFGIIYTPETFEVKLQEMATTYDHWAARMSEYPYTAEQTSEAYFQLFTDLMTRRETILASRDWMAPSRPRLILSRAAHKLRQVIRL